MNCKRIASKAIHSAKINWPKLRNVNAISSNGWLRWRKRWRNNKRKSNSRFECNFGLFFLFTIHILSFPQHMEIMNRKSRRSLNESMPPPPPPVEREPSAKSKNHNLFKLMSHSYVIGKHRTFSIQSISFLHLFRSIFQRNPSQSVHQCPESTSNKMTQ